MLPGQKLSWHIYVYNHAEGAEYVSVRIKILNSTDDAPDVDYSGGASGQALYEFRRLLARNSSWTIPLDWMISNVSTEDPGHRYVTIKGLDINNHHVGGLNVTSLQGKDFRMIIELWRYDMQNKAFVFQGFPENDNNRSAWNQIWFNLKV